MLRQKAFLNLISALIVLMAQGCTITGAERAATEDLHWLGFKSHTDLKASNRWQFAPDTRVRISEAHPAADQQWLHAAEEGFYSIFEPPGDTVDLVLLISWPEERRAQPDGRSGWRLLPKTSDPVDITLKLLSPDDGRVVQVASLRVDPSWFSSAGNRPGQIQRSFVHYAESLSARR